MSMLALPPTLAAEIDAIRGLASQPAVRNLRITQSYSEISRAFAAKFGADNVNWCTFAVWASKTAGRFIRMRDSPLLAEALRASEPVKRTLEALNHALERIHLSARLPDSTLTELVARIIEATSSKVSGGNFTVYDELAPLFGRMLLPMDVAAFQVFVVELNESQDLLRSAFTHYNMSLTETGAHRKAEYILLANAQTGLHEQIRLQPYIAGSLEAPIDEILRDLMRKHHRLLPLLVEELLDPVFHVLLAPVAKAVREVWLEFATHFLMDLTFPDGTLRLGHDVPAPLGAPLFPMVLQDIAYPPLRELLEQYDAADSTTRDSGAINWADLSDRMRYILELFRSRQQDPRLFEPPFDAGQTASIAVGLVGDGEP